MNTRVCDDDIVLIWVLFNNYHYLSLFEEIVIYIYKMQNNQENQV